MANGHVAYTLPGICSADLKAMQRIDIKNATDQELLDFSRPQPWELLLPRLAGVSTSLLLAGALVFGSIWFFREAGLGPAQLLVGVAGLLLGVAFSFFLVMGLVISLIGLPERRSRRHRCELLQRFGQAGFDRDLEAALSHQDERSTPDITLFFSGQQMPHGRIYWARLLISKNNGQGQLQIESRVGPRIDVDNAEDPLSQVVRRCRDLPLYTVAPLLKLLDEHEPTAFRNVKSCFINGLPCEVAILRKGDPQVYRGGCNYVPQDNRLQSAPVMRLVGMILELMESPIGPQTPPDGIPLVPDAMLPILPTIEAEL